MLWEMGHSLSYKELHENIDVSYLSAKCKANLSGWFMKTETLRTGLSFDR